MLTFTNLCNFSSAKGLVIVKEVRCRHMWSKSLLWNIWWVTNEEDSGTISVTF